MAYADDVAVSVRGKIPNTLANRMQTILDNLNRWAISCGLNLNASKTELVLFTRKHNTPVVTLPVLSGRRLIIGDKESSLGLILNRKLSWKQNLDTRVRNGSTALYTCKWMMGANASDSLLALHNGCQTNHVIRYIGMVANNGKEIRGEAYGKYTKSSQYMH